MKEYEYIKKSLPNVTKEDKEKNANFIQNTGIAYQIIEKHTDGIVETYGANGELKHLNVNNFEVWINEIEKLANHKQKSALEELKKIVRGDKETLAKYAAGNKKNLRNLVESLSTLYPTPQTNEHLKKNYGAAVLESVLVNFVLPTFTGRENESQYKGFIDYVKDRYSAHGKNNESYETTKGKVFCNADIRKFEPLKEDPSIGLLVDHLKNKSPQLIDKVEIELAWENINSSDLLVTEADVISKIGYEIYYGSEDYLKTNGSSEIDANKLKIIKEYEHYIKKHNPDAVIYKDQLQYIEMKTDVNGKKALASLYNIAESRFNYFKNNILAGTMGGVSIYTSDESLFSDIKFSISIEEFKNLDKAKMAQLADLALLACDDDTITSVLSEKINRYFKFSDHEILAFTAEERQLIESKGLIFSAPQDLDFYLKDRNLLDENLVIFISHCDNQALREDYVKRLLENDQQYTLTDSLVFKCSLYNQEACQNYLKSKIESGDIDSDNFMNMISKISDNKNINDFITLCIENNRFDLLLDERFNPSSLSSVSDELNKTIGKQGAVLHQNPELIDKLGGLSADLKTTLTNSLLIEITFRGIPADDKIKQEEMAKFFSTNDAKTLSKWIDLSVTQFGGKFLNSRNAPLVVDKFPIQFFENLHKLYTDSILENQKLSKNAEKLKEYIDKAKNISKDSVADNVESKIAEHDLDGATDIYFELLNKINDKRYKEERSHAASSKFSDSTDITESLPHLSRSRRKIEKNLLNEFYKLNKIERRNFLEYLKAKNSVGGTDAENRHSKANKEIINVSSQLDKLNKQLESARNSGQVTRVRDLVVEKNAVEKNLSELYNVLEAEKIWRRNHIDTFVEHLEKTINALDPQDLAQAFEISNSENIESLTEMLTIENIRVASITLSQKEKESIVKKIDSFLSVMAGKSELTDVEIQQKNRLLVARHLLGQSMDYSIGQPSIVLSQKELDNSKDRMAVVISENVGAKSELATEESQQAKSIPETQNKIILQIAEEFLVEDRWKSMLQSADEKFLMYGTDGFTKQELESIKEAHTAYVLFVSEASYIKTDKNLEDQFKNFSEESEEERSRSESEASQEYSPSVQISGGEEYEEFERNISSSEVKESFNSYTIESLNSEDGSGELAKLYKLLKQHIANNKATPHLNQDENGKLGYLNKNALKIAIGVTNESNYALNSAINKCTDTYELGKMYSVIRILNTKNDDTDGLKKVMDEEYHQRPPKIFGQSRFQKNVITHQDKLSETRAKMQGEEGSHSIANDRKL